MSYSLLGSLAGLDPRSARSWLVLRMLLAGLIAAHGWARLVTGGVAPFGAWLDSQGIPAGLLIAGSITAFEIIGTIVFATAAPSTHLSPLAHH